MKLTRIELEGIGRFEKASVEGLSDGVNLLAAANEAGKSTIFRAVRYCLFKRFGAADREVQSLDRDGSRMPPTVTLGFDHDGESYTLRKTFLRSKAALLTKNGTDFARDSEADEAAWEILGLKPGSGRTLDDAAFGILWVGQRAAIDLPQPTTAAADQLNSLIEGEVGILVGGERARAILNRLGRELARELTTTGRIATGGTLHTANARADELRGKVEELSRRERTLESQFAELTNLRSARARLADPVAIAAADKDLRAARKDLAAADEAGAALANFAQRQEQAAVAHDAALRDFERHRVEAERIGALRIRAVALAEELERHDARLGEYQNAEAAARQRLENVNRRSAALQPQEQALRALELAARRAERAHDALERRDALVALQDELIAVDAEIAALPVTAEALAEAQKIDTEIDKVEVRLAAGATVVQLDVTHEGADMVTVSGGDLSSGGQTPILRDMRIDIDGLATVTLRPPSGYGSKDQVRLDALRKQLGDLLALWGAGSIDEARSVADRQADAERRRIGIVERLKALRVDERTLAAAIQVVRTEDAETDRVVRDALAKSGETALPPIETIEADLARIAAERQALEIDRSRLQPAFDEARKVSQDVALQRSQLQGEHASLERELADALVRLPDELRPAEHKRLARTVSEAARALAAAGGDLAAAQTSAPDRSETDRRRLRVERLEAATVNRTTEIGGLDQKIARLEGQISTAGGEGISEERAVLQEQLELAERDAERIAKRVAAQSLLKEAVETALQEGRDQYNAPILQHLTPYLHDLFPDAALEVGDGFSITGLRRAVPERIERLSDGTQEQIAVLVRLAMGSFLAEKGQVVPIILDDALVFSDDDRIERMFDALTRAGEKQQVLVFTCRTRTFQTLGARHLRITVA